MENCQVYSSGFCCASICVPKSYTKEQIEEIANILNPTGISSRWEISEDKQFKTGHSMPCMCESDPNKMHSSTIYISKRYKI